MANFLDIALPIVEKNELGEFRATPYFEDYLFQIINSIGGEGAETSLDDSLSLLVAANQAKVSKLEKDLLNIDHPNQSMLTSKISAHDERLSNLEQLVSELSSENAYLRALLGKLSVFNVVELAAGDTTYTTSGNTILICNNTGLATVTLNATAANKEEVIIVRNAAGGVNVTAVKKISGKTIKTILRRYTSPRHIFTTIADSWSVI